MRVWIAEGYRDRGDHAFGLTPSERVQNDQTNGRVFHASLFDIGEEGKGNKIVIYQSSTGLMVSIEADKKQLISCPEQLIRTGTTVYREADNSCMKKSLRSFMSSDDDERTVYLNNFEKCTLEEADESKVFLNGALKITRTTFNGPFNFHGRIEQNKTEQMNFDKVVKFLKEEKSMV